MCSGKIYFDLQERQEKDKRTDVAIIRLEQLHPFPANQINDILAEYKGSELIWIQEEPENMGYWTYILRVFKNQSIKLISRKASASPATGYAKVHASEQEKLVDQAFA
jgi:2-oxoglutarate dehydrogenase E1 component